MPQQFGAKPPKATPRKQAEEALRQVTRKSERDRRLYEALLSTTPDLVYVLDLNHRFIYANDALLRTWGKTWDEAIGKNRFELGYDPWHAAKHDYETQQVIATKKPIRGEVPFTGTNGRRIYDYIFVPVSSPNGEVEAIAGTARDVTERKFAEERLRESEQRFFQLAETIPQLAWMANPDGYIFWYNRRWYEYTGTTKEQMEGWDWQSVYAPDELPKVLESWSKSISNGKSFKMVFPLRGANGAFRPFLTCIEPLCDNHGTIVRWIGTSTDISEQLATEARLREQARLLDLSNDAIVVRDWEGRILYWSQGAEQLYGSKREGALGKNYHEFLQTRFPKPFAEIKEELLRKGHWTGELVQTTRDGRRITVLCRKVLDRDVQGNPAAVLESNADISERKRAEEALRQSHETFFNLVERAPFGIYIVDSSFRIAVMNPGSQTGAFSNVRSAVGRDFGEAMRILWPESVAAEIIRILRNTLDTGEPYYSRDFIRPRQDIQAEEAYEWELHRITLPDGRHGVVCYYFDSTKLRQTEQALRRSEQALRNRSEQLAAALAASDTGTFRWNPHTGEFLEFDDNLKRLVGKPAAEFKVTEDFLQSVHPEDLPALTPAVEACRRGADFSMEYRVLEEDGHIRWLYERAKMEWENGKPTYLVGACIDITERKRSEEALQKSEQRLRQIEKMAAAGQLAASLAHEINNPLSSVRNALYLLDHSRLEGDEKSLVRTAGNELGRVSRIVRQSLSYYRVGTVPKEVDLADILEESLQIFSERLQRKNIQLTKRISSGNRIIGFADEIRQVIDNLLLNALEATPSGGRLAVSLRRSHRWSNHQSGVRLTIGDSGCGVPREHLSRIFEPFFTTKAEKGTGLGLWIVRGIVAKHEGQIDIRSKETAGKSGTVVSIWWRSGDQGHRGQPARPESTT